MSLDYKLALESAAWSLLEASAAFTTEFTAGRRLKQSGDKWLRELHLRAPADFPSIAIEIRNGTIPPGMPRTFGMNSTGFTYATCDLSLPFTQQIAIVITYDKVRSGDATPLETIVEKLVMSKWPKFGLSWVQNFSTSTSRTEMNVGGVRRPRTTILLAFQCRTLLSTLVA